MPWIDAVSYDDSTGRLRALYDRIAGPGNNVDNIMLLHSLRPHTLEGHMALYKAVLHHAGNTLPKWFLEAVGVRVSLLNGCDYCVHHHTAGMRRLIDDAARSDAVLAALRTGDIDGGPFSDGERAALRYVEALTHNPASVAEDMVVQMRTAGLDDGKILEINQVASYFAYANRTVLGLGCSIEGDVLGLSPGNADDPDDWSHA